MLVKSRLMLALAGILFLGCVGAVIGIVSAAHPSASTPSNSQITTNTQGDTATTAAPTDTPTTAQPTDTPVVVVPTQPTDDNPTPVLNPTKNPVATATRPVNQNLLVGVITGKTSNPDTLTVTSGSNTITVLITNTTSFIGDIRSFAAENIGYRVFVQGHYQDAKTFVADSISNDT